MGGAIAPAQPRQPTRDDPGAWRVVRERAAGRGTWCVRAWARALAAGDDCADDGRVYVRPPWRLWKFLAADLLRLGVLSCGALITTIAFAFSVRFLAEGRVDVAGATRITLLALVPMLQYALPFAGCFAAMLTYHRFASDQEAVAASAAGVSWRAVLTPALVAGVVIGSALLFLSHQVMPRFLRAMEEVVTRDVTGVLVRAIDRGDPVRLGTFQIYAQDIVRTGTDPRSGAFDRLYLRGVLAAQIDENGAVVGSMTGDEVGVWLFEEENAGERFTSAQLVFKDAQGHGDGDLFQGGSVATQRFRVPSAFVEDPKYKTRGELLALRAHPESFGRIAGLRADVVRRLEERRAIEETNAALQRTGRARFVRPDGEVLELRAARLAFDGPRWSVVAASGARPLVQRTLAGGSVITLEAQAAWLEPDAAEAPVAGGRGSGTLRLVAQEARNMDRGVAAPTLTGGAARIGSLAVPDAAPIPENEALDSLLARARATTTRPGATGLEPLSEAARRLERRIADLQREITSKLHERAAYALASCLAVLAGAVTALRRQEALPLTVYLWSFFPALAAVITISAGQGLTHKSGDVGLLLLWGGVALLGLQIAWEYRRLARH